MDEVLYACRFVQFTAAMAVFGASSFRFYALAGGHASAAPNILAGFDSWLGRVTLAEGVVDARDRPYLRRGFGRG